MCSVTSCPICHERVTDSRLFSLFMKPCPWLFVARYRTVFRYLPKHSGRCMGSRGEARNNSGRLSVSYDTGIFRPWPNKKRLTWERKRRQANRGLSGPASLSGRLLLVMAIQRLQQVVKRLDKHMIRQSIVNGGSLLTRGNQVEIGKLVQMLRGGSVAQSQFFSDLS